MSLITLQGVGFDYGRQTILDGANLTIHAGERYGLVGINGAGKTTLLRLILGQLEPPRGKIQRAARVSVGYLPQDSELESPLPVREAVRQAAFADLLRIEAELEELSHRLGAGDEDPRVLEEYGSLHERFEQADAYTMDSRCEAAMLGLGFEADRLDQPLNTLSGGQRRRAALAAVLLAPHDVLLLDEPTNHLDLDAREWLEEHLMQRRGAMIAISHDRAFLDHATDFTLHLFNARLDRFPGSYTKFHRLWAEQKGQWEERYRRQQEHIERTETFIRKNIAGQRTGQAKSRRKQLARLDRIEAPPSDGKQYRFNLAPARVSGNLVFETHGLTHRFGSLRLFEDLDCQVLRGDKIGIIGPNGTGKTTLLKLLTRALVPIDGSIAAGHNVDLGYYDQDLRAVNDTNTVLGEIRLLDPESSDGTLRTFLGAFGFGADMIDQRVGTLSGGERARLSLLRLILERHNTLLLDEPTNHLDYDAREALEEALATFSGTLICVSHDRYFLNRIVNRVFAFETGAAAASDRAAQSGEPAVRVRQVLGNYDDYRRAVLAEREALAETTWGSGGSRAATPAPRTPGTTKGAPAQPAKPDAAPPEAAQSDPRAAGATRPRATPPGSLGPRGRKPGAGQPAAGPLRKRDLGKNELARLRREVGDLEDEIALIEADLESLGGQLSGGALSASELVDASTRAARLQAALNEKLRRWEELAVLLERDPSAAPAGRPARQSDRRPTDR
jgi:ATP-binding cassette subfamily F protein 3